MSRPGSTTLSHRPLDTNPRSIYDRGRKLTVAITIFVVPAFAIALFAGIRVQGDLGSVVSTFSTRFLGIFIEAAPFLLLGSLVSGLIEVFVSRERLTGFIPRNPLLAIFSGTFLGFLFPVCECGVVPVTRRLYMKGLPISVGVAFLLASPVMNPIVLVSTWAAFGLGPVLIGRYVITALVAIAIGLVFAASPGAREILQARVFASLSSGSTESAPHVEGPGLMGRFSAALTLASDEFFDMGRYLVVGTLLASAMQTVVSQDVLTSLGHGPVTSVLTMQVLAYVLSVCSTVDAFLALAFAGTFTGGSILAFLTFGPMVDTKSTLMFLGVFRPRAVAYLIALPLMMTMAVGIWLNLNVALQGAT
jgi:uncharacterized protein